MRVTNRRNLYKLKGKSQSQIFSSSLSWLAETFKSSKSVIELQDKASGKIIGNITTSSNWMGRIMYYQSKMVIEIKNGKSRLTLTPVSAMLDNGSPARIMAGDKDNIQASLKDIINNYKTYMSGAGKKDNW